jgi:hypothetical protein
MNRTLLLSLVSLLFATGCNAQLPKTGTARLRAANANAVTWGRYEDPTEKAFSIDAPQEWEVKGGTYRFGYFDVRWMMDARSPDGKIVVRINDANVPPYALPGPNAPPEGRPFNKPQQFQMVVSHYRTGQDFAESYGRKRFQSVCRNLQPRNAAWRPQLPAAFDDGAARQSSEGSSAYACESSAGPREARIYARTLSYDVAHGSGFWSVSPVVSILASPERLEEARLVAEHMITTWQKDPQWEAYQKQLAQMGLQQIQASFQQFMAQMQQYHQQRTSAWNQQVAGFEKRQNESAAQSSNWGEILTGLTDATDPLTGEHFQVWTGPNANYYRNGMGTTVNSNSLPGAGYHKLDTQPH